MSPKDNNLTIKMENALMNEPWYILPKQKLPEQSAIIIGGGLAGTSCARSLAERGFRVTLIEREATLASGASGNPAGIVTPLITHKSDLLGQFYLAGFYYTLQILKQLDNVTHKQCGMIQLAADKVTKTLDETVIPPESIQSISAEEASNISNLEITSNALHLPECALVVPTDLCRANIQHPHISVQYHTDILSLERKNNRWHVRDHSGDIADAPIVIIANSGDARAFSELEWLPLQQVRGQLTYLPGGVASSRTILCYNGGYLSPKIGGQSYVGATYNRAATTLEVTKAEHEENLAHLRQNIALNTPDISKLQGRAAFRATLPDRRAAIGRVPDHAAFLRDYADWHHGRPNANYPAGRYLEGLYTSVGHGSRGLTSCSIGGELLAAMICNESLPLPTAIVNSLSPARFIMRELKRQAA